MKWTVRDIVWELPECFAFPFAMISASVSHKAHELKACPTEWLWEGLWDPVGGLPCEGGVGSVPSSSSFSVFLFHLLSHGLQLGGSPLLETPKVRSQHKPYF